MVDTMLETHVPHAASGETLQLIRGEIVVGWLLATDFPIYLLCRIVLFLRIAKDPFPLATFVPCLDFKYTLF